MKKVIISICIMVSLMGVFVNVNASEDQEMITSNQVLEDGFLEETEEEEFLNFSTKVNVDWTVKPQILKRSKGFTKKAGSIIYINLKIFRTIVNNLKNCLTIEHEVDNDTLRIILNERKQQLEALNLNKKYSNLVKIMLLLF